MRKKRQTKERIFVCLTDKVYPVCGKTFIPAPQHAYKDQRNKARTVCSWHCVCESKRLKEAANQAKAKKGGKAIESRCVPKANSKAR